MCRSRNCLHNSTNVFFSIYGIEELDKQRHIQFGVGAKLQIANGDGWISFISMGSGNVCCKLFNFI